MYKRGDVYMMDLNPYSGSEQGGIRPAIVVQNDDGNFYSNVLLVVPLTTQIKKRNMPTHFMLSAKIGRRSPINRCQSIRTGCCSSTPSPGISRAITVFRTFQPERKAGRESS